MTAARPEKTVQELADLYIVARRCGVSQVRSLARVLPRFGKMTATQITPERIQAFKKSRRDVQDATVRRELGALIAVLSWGAKTRQISRDTVPHIDLPPAGQPRDVFMSREQAAHFESAALAFPRFKGRVGAFVSIALNTAARKEAIQQLTWDRVNLEARTIDFIKPGMAVSRKRRKVLPISDSLLSTLSLLNTNRCDGSNLVVGQGSLRAAYSAFTSSIGMEWVTPHILRHTAGSLMLASGVSIWQVSEVLGDTPATVARHYGHSLTSQLQAAVNTLGRHPRMTDQNGVSQGPSGC